MQKGARIFQKVRPKVDGYGNSSSAPKRELITMIVDTLSVSYYEKMVDYMPSRFSDLVFAGERIEVAWGKWREGEGGRNPC